jgi:hypothetical protein
VGSVVYSLEAAVKSAPLLRAFDAATLAETVAPPLPAALPQAPFSIVVDPLDAAQLGLLSADEPSGGLQSACQLLYTRWAPGTDDISQTIELDGPG